MPTASFFYHRAPAETQTLASRAKDAWTAAKSLVRETRRREALRPLLKLEDWQLADIGLERADVERTLGAPLWNAPQLTVRRRLDERATRRPSNLIVIVGGVQERAPRVR